MRFLEYNTEVIMRTAGRAGRVAEGEEVTGVSDVEIEAVEEIGGCETV